MAGYLVRMLRRNISLDGLEFYDKRQAFTASRFSVGGPV